MRGSWRIPSVEMLKSLAVTKLCWKFRTKFRELEQQQITNAGAVTRNVSSLRMPLARGLMALSVEVPCRRTWNTLPDKIKNEDDKEKAFGMIKSWIAKRPMKSPY